MITPQHTQTISAITKLRALLIALALTLLIACSGGGSTQSGDDSISDVQGTTTDNSQTESSFTGIENQSNIATGTPDNANELLVDTGNLLPVLFETQTDLDLDYARTGVNLIEQMNSALILPNDIDVIFADCGVANAFFVPTTSFSGSVVLEDEVPRSAGGSIFMCHELTQLFSNFYSDKDQAVSASIFVLMHELGHALVNQLELPVLGIEESYVDGISAVFLGEAGLSEGVALAGWFFASQPGTPFFDTHRAGPQRLGDLACWGIGADLTLLDDPTINNIAQQLMNSGRNCAAEYAQQRNALNDVLGAHIRGDISGIFGGTINTL